MTDAAPSDAVRKAKARKTVIAILMLTTAVAAFLWTLILVGSPGRRGAALFKWHIILMPFATVILLPASTLVWTTRPSERTETTQPHYYKQKAVHAAFAILSLIVMSVGISVAYVSHVQQGFANFYSLHSWVGMAAILAIKTNIVIGATSACLTSCGRSFGPFERHRFVGRLAVGLSFVSSILGFGEMQTFVVRDHGPRSLTAFGAGVLAIAMIVVGACVMCEISAEGCAGLQQGGKMPDGNDDMMVADDNDDAGMKVGMPPIKNVNSDTREVSSGSGSSI